MNDIQNTFKVIIGLLATAIALIMTATFVFIKKDSVNEIIAARKAERERKADTESTVLNIDLNESKSYFGAISGVAKSEKYEFSDKLALLGKHLYFDTRLSAEGNNSCNSCHNLDTYGVDNLSFSPGDAGGLGGRNSPTTLNAAFHFLQFWDGREPDVEAQAGGPILNPVEMNIPSKEFLIDRLKKIEGYRNLFNEVYGESDSSVNYWNIQHAIGAFERTLVTPSKFDEFINGKEDELNDKEQKGLISFVDNGCIQCHNGALFGGTSFQKFGVYKPYWEATGSKKHDEGRFEVTQKESDKYMFKVPSLRNVEKTAPYFHDGSVETLAETIKIMGDIQLNKQLSDEEISDIEAFLSTLTGELSEEQKTAPEMF